MARVVLTNDLPEYQFWANMKDDSFGTELVTNRTAKLFKFKLATSGDFANWTVSVSGKNFSYLDNGSGLLEPTGGIVSAITFANDLGDTVLTIDSFSAAWKPFLEDVHFSLFGGGGDGSSSLWDFFSFILATGDTILGSDRGDDIGSGRNTGNDKIFGFGGDDFIKGDAGNDTVLGGDGHDTLSFEETFWDSTAYRGMYLDVAAGQVSDPWGGKDTFNSIERFIGSRFRDVMSGSDGREIYFGLRGNDFLYGGEGSDSARYYRDEQYGGRRGIIVDLETSSDANGIYGTIRDGFGHRDTVHDIENVHGTMFDDIFVGSSVNNTFVGLGGVDSFDGRAGSEDRVDFSANDFNGGLNGVRVNLSKASGQIIDDGYGNTESVVSIEKISGTKFGDTIRGNGADNYLEGFGGSDTLAGGGGRDLFGYITEDEFGDTILDFTSGVDSFVFDAESFGGVSGLDNVVRFNVGAGPTQAGASFYFNAADRTLYYDQDGTGGAFGGLAIATIQVGGTVAAGDIIIVF